MKVRVGTRYVFDRNGYDQWDTDATKEMQELPDGTIIKVISLYGCPPANMMGMCYIGDADTGKFIGMCDTRSLITADTWAERQAARVK